MIEPHISGPSHTLYELGRIVLTFGLIGLGIWIVIRLMVGAGKRGSDHRASGVNRQQRQQRYCSAGWYRKKQMSDKKRVLIL